MSAPVTFVIMAGGRGERLWPLVRATSPKVCLSPDGSRSLLRATVERLRSAWPGTGIMVVTTAEQAAAVRAQLPASLRRAVLVEPRIRNTAACMTLAAVALAARDPDQVMVAVPADHWIDRMSAYRQAVQTAIRAALEHETIATVGIKPTRAHSGLGYLCAGRRLSAPGGGARVFRLARFVEKPSAAAAAKLLRRPGTYWNSGTFVGTAETFLSRITEWLPDHSRRLVPLARRVWRGGGSLRRAYDALQPISFDHGVMVHLRDGVVVEGRYGWADLGSWDVWAALGRNGSPTLTVDGGRVTVVSQPNHLVATIGVKDLLIVQTPTATLVCRADRVQGVRELVRRLQANRRFARFV